MGCSSSSPPPPRSPFRQLVPPPPRSPFRQLVPPPPRSPFRQLVDGSFELQQRQFLETSLSSPSQQPVYGPLHRQQLQFLATTEKVLVIVVFGPDSCQSSFSTLCTNVQVDYGHGDESISKALQMVGPILLEDVFKNLFRYIASDTRTVALMSEAAVDESRLSGDTQVVFIDTPHGFVSNNNNNERGDLEEEVVRSQLSCLRDVPGLCTELVVSDRRMDDAVALVQALQNVPRESLRTGQEALANITNRSKALRDVWLSRPKIMLFGGMGAGKSSLINVLFNNSIRKEHLVQPAATSEGVGGCTDKCKAYQSNRYELIDSVGLDDNRFSTEDILRAIGDMIVHCKNGVNAVVFVVKKETKVSEESQRAMRMFLELFGREHLRTRCFVVVTNDREGDGPVWLRQQVDERGSGNAAEYAQCLQEVASGDNVLSGSLQTGDEALEQYYRPKRQELLDSLVEELNRDRYRDSMTLQFTHPDDGFIINLAYTLCKIWRPDVKYSKVAHYLKLRGVRRWFFGQN